MAVRKVIYLKPAPQRRQELRHKLHAMGPKMLEHIREQEPIFTGLMRRMTYAEPFDEGGVSGIGFGVEGHVWYWPYTEYAPPWPGYGPRTPGTRMPWLEPGVKETIPWFDDLVVSWSQSWTR